MKAQVDLSHKAGKVLTALLEGYKIEFDNACWVMSEDFRFCLEGRNELTGEKVYLPTEVTLQVFVGMVERMSESAWIGLVSALTLQAVHGKKRR